MILFIYGEDTFRSKQKLDAIKAKYIDVSLGDTNLSTADFADKDIDYTQITRMVLAMPFLAKSRLVIFKNLLLEGKKDLQEKVLAFLPKIPQSTNLIFYESNTPDRRSALFKKLDALALPGGPKISQEFKPLQGYQLRKWIENEVQNLGGSIEESAVDKLIEYVGNDLWRLSNEISKLTAYCLKLTAQDVEHLVKPKIEGNIFGMIDALGQKNSQKAIKLLHDLIDSGENELYIFTMIIYQFRNLLIVKDYLENSNDKIQILNQSLKFKISKLTGLNPYVVQKTTIQARNFTFDELKAIYQKLLDYDVKMKTGKIDPNIALDILVVELCKN